LKAIKWMLMTHSPLMIWPLLDGAMWRSRGTGAEIARGSFESRQRQQASSLAGARTEHRCGHVRSQAI
jgi:hypothetical protein